MTDIISNNILQANRALNSQEINFINSFMDCIPTHHNRMLNFFDNLPALKRRGFPL